jgi:hypothetical protein
MPHRARDTDCAVIARLDAPIRCFVACGEWQSATIIRSGPRLFENISRRVRIKKRPGGNTPGYVARAVDVGGLAGLRALGKRDTGNPRFRLDACLYNVLKRLAAPSGDAARKLFGFRRQDDCQKILREMSWQFRRSDIPAQVGENNNHV